MKRKINSKGMDTRESLLLKELRGYEREGMQLYLNDSPSRADEIANACILSETSNYMRDFISDDQDHITGVRFIQISENPDS